MFVLEDLTGIRAAMERVKRTAVLLQVCRHMVRVACLTALISSDVNGYWIGV